MKILFCAAEVYPFSKTGGLGDVAGALPGYLLKKNIDVTVITPLYLSVQKHKENMKYLGMINLEIGNQLMPVYYHEMYHLGVRHIFVENNDLFNRDMLYGYDDDALRFTFFNIAILEFISFDNQFYQLIHINDWQTGLIPYLLDEKYRWRREHKNIHTLLTIHNLEYQGQFDLSNSYLFNTPQSYSYEHFGRLNFLKCGISRASFINVVSPQYAFEVLTQFYGFSLDGSLSMRSNDLVGVLNGIDYDIWNPRTDKLIHKKFNSKNYKVNKKINKDYLSNKCNFTNLEYPTISFIGRLASQKGIDLLDCILEELINTKNFNLVLLGSGEKKYEDYLRYLSDKYQGRVYAWVGFENKFAHEIYAGSDLFLMPSLFEPCGLGQMISQRYATLPIARETGGLKNTVQPYNKFTKEGNGFTFANYNAHELKDTIASAIDLYYENNKDFDILIQNALKENNSMTNMAKNYIKLYKDILKEK